MMVGFTAVNLKETLVEQKYNASVAEVFALLTDPKWLEARSLALGELSAKVKAKKSAQGATLTMTRRVKRELPAIVAKVLPSESDLLFEEAWESDGEGGYDGTLAMDMVGQPVKMTAEFTLEAAGKGCIYKIEHDTRCSVPLVGRAVAKFGQAQIEQGCADEFKYLVGYLKQAS
jgi:hypothetical protein